MKASELFAQIKKDLEALSAYRAMLEQKLRDEKDSIGHRMTKYNYDTFLEILARQKIEPDFDINDVQFNDFEQRIDHYLGLYTPKNEDLKTYVKGISTYLIFIAKKPLHPPGLEELGGMKIAKSGDSYVCSGKRRYIKDELSLCKPCICKASPF